MEKVWDNLFTTLSKTRSREWIYVQDSCERLHVPGGGSPFCLAQWVKASPCAKLHKWFHHLVTPGFGAEHSWLSSGNPGLQGVWDSYKYCGLQLQARSPYKPREHLPVARLLASRWGAAVGGSSLNCRHFSLLMLASTDTLFHEAVPW